MYISMFAEFMAPHVDAIADELIDAPFDAVLALTTAMQSAARIVKQAGLIPSGKDAPARTAHWVLQARSAFGLGDLDALRATLRRLPRYSHLFADDGGRTVPRIDAEALEECLRELHSQQAQRDMVDDLAKEPDPKARRTIRESGTWRVAALAPQAVHCITVLGADGMAAAVADESAALLVAHWGRSSRSARAQARFFDCCLMRGHSTRASILCR